MTIDRPSPSGTVTFLFSDIEGSSRLEQEVGTEVYATVLARHRAILRAAFEAHGGVEQGTEGDSFFVVFPSASEALRAAVESQLGLAAEAWPEGRSVRVRMGVHTGDVTRVGEGYVGIDINRTARIAAAGHGGQVLVSAASRGLIGESLPAGAGWRDLGAYRLRDFPEPERLSQLVVDGLAAEFPALRTVDARPNNLPVSLTTFVGRERELTDARRLLTTARLLTITGPGGMGKTRFAIELAHAAAIDFPDGAFFVPLEPVVDPLLVPGTIAHTIGIVESGARPPLELLVELLAGQRVLLILDNFERLTAAAPVIGDLLRAAPGLRFVVTSQAILHLSGEHEFPLDGLAVPPVMDRLTPEGRIGRAGVDAGAIEPERLLGYDAVRLFVERAMAARPSFSLDRANAPAIARICARLDGMPLPIELAAVRVRVLTPDAILTRLEHQFELLASAARDVPERQRTLRGAIAWSYDLLDEPSQHLLDRLGCFSGGCNLETAELVCGPADELGRDVFDGIADLADQSLIRRSEAGGEIRFSMPDTIRAFAVERLEGRGEAEPTRRRHAEAFLALARTAATRLSGDDQREWVERLEREHDNFRAVLDWAVKTPEPTIALELAFLLWRFWQKRGHLAEARRLLDDIAERPWAKEDPVAYARLQEAHGGVAYWQGDFAGALPSYQAALERWRELGDRTEIANALYNLAFTYNIGEQAQGVAATFDMSRGRALLDESLAIYRDLGDQRGIGNALWAIGAVEMFAQKRAETLPIFAEAREAFKEAGDRTMEAWALHMTGIVSVLIDDFVSAEDAFRHAHRHFKDAGDITGQALVVDDYATLALASGDKERGIRLWAAARRIQQTLGTRIVQASSESSQERAWRSPEPGDATPERRAELEVEGRSWTLEEALAYAVDGTLPG
ncbi:MAG: adenylate/guanylate cyclase domain-containing protein [Chloroflexota bacterium]